MHIHILNISGIAVHMHKQHQGCGIGHNDSWRVEARQESAGGLKVRALAQTVRDAGSSPACCSIFLVSKIALREKIINLIHISNLINVYLE